MPFTLTAECGDGLIDDDALIPALNAAAVACGAQSIAEEDQRRCIRLCHAHGVDVGAAPDSAARTTLGRRVAVVDPESLAATVGAQVTAFRRLCDEEGAALRFVRMRGTLQAFAATDPDVADAVARAVAALDPTLVLVAPAESHLFLAARRAGLHAAGEMFVDRIYESDGTLRGRTLPGAQITDLEACLQQALSIAQQHYVRTYDGTRLFIEAHALCLDAHMPQTAARARFLRREMARAGVVCAGYPLGAAGVRGR